MRAENGQVVWLHIVLLARVYGKQSPPCLTGNSTGHSPSGIRGSGPLVGPPELNKSLGGCGVGDAEALRGGDRLLLRGGVLVGGMLAGGGVLVGAHPLEKSAPDFVETSIHRLFLLNEFWQFGTPRLRKRSS